MLHAAVHIKSYLNGRVSLTLRDLRDMKYNIREISEDIRPFSSKYNSGTSENGLH